MFQLSTGVCKYGLDCRFLHEENVDPEEVESEAAQVETGEKTQKKRMKL